MNAFEKKVEQFIRSENMLQPSAKVIVGLSGGADSVALLAVLSRLGYDCIASHCNFNLRGEESLRDMAHARLIAEKLGCRFRFIDFDVDAYRAAADHPVSIEMACRELRYEWFEKIRIEENTEVIAVAHSKNDNVETMMLNLLRGTGLAGLRGMLPRNDRRIIRPLLCCTRQDIEDYLAERELEYITDSSNLECHYTRNKLRNRVLPAIAEWFPDAAERIAATIEILRSTESFYKESLENKRKEYVDSTGAIQLKQLIEREPSHALLLYEWLSPNGLSMQQIKDIIHSADSSGKRFITDCGHYYTDRGMLRFAPAKEGLPDFDQLFSLQIRSAKDFKPSGDKFTAYFDTSILDAGKLEVRNWQKSDRIRPFGMKGSKLVSDIFSDAKISLEAKSRIPLLTIGNVVLWIPGLRHSREFSIVPDSGKYIEITYIGPTNFLTPF